jgi:hypothetical protein
MLIQRTRIFLLSLQWHLDIRQTRTIRVKCSGCLQDYIRNWHRRSSRLLLKRGLIESGGQAGVMMVFHLLVSNDQARMRAVDYSGKRVCYRGK